MFVKPISASPAVLSTGPAPLGQDDRVRRPTHRLAFRALAAAVLVLTLPLLSCSAIAEGGEGCYDRYTGEPLPNIRDASGKSFQSCGRLPAIPYWATNL